MGTTGFRTRQVGGAATEGRLFAKGSVLFTRRRDAVFLDGFAFWNVPPQIYESQ
jgi:hypothetical protein